MNRHFSIVAALSAALPLVGACSVGDAPEARVDVTASALENAPEDHRNTFAVGVCSGPLDAVTSGCKSGRCTGTLIAPNLVLTARHCVNFPTANAPTSLCTNHRDNFFDPSTLKRPADVRVTVDPSVSEGSPRWYGVSEISVPAGTRACDDDVALLRLTDNIPATEAGAIAADIYTDLADYPPTALAIIGRGAIAAKYDPVTGARIVFDSGGYRRRILQNVPVLCVSNTDGACGTLYDYTILDPPRGFVLSTGVLLYGLSSHAGDSGAGYLDQARFDRGQPTVVAVNSYGGVDSSGIEYAGFAVRLTQHASFLVSGAVKAAREGGYPLPGWVGFPGTRCGDNFCGPGTYCCNSCAGICAPKGGYCTQACNH